jgi:hypothetical protein
MTIGGGPFLFCIFNCMNTSSKESRLISGLVASLAGCSLGLVE